MEFHGYGEDAAQPMLADIVHVPGPAFLVADVGVPDHRIGSLLTEAGPLIKATVGYPTPGEKGAGRVLGDVLRVLEPLGEPADFEFDP